MTRLSAAREIQQQQIVTLMKESFEALSRRQVREQLALPSELRGLKLYILRGPGERGGVEIHVEIQRRSLLIFMHRSTDGFEMLPDGTIIPHRAKTYDHEKITVVPKEYLGGLPPDIEHQVVEYLRLEFGEDESDPDKLKIGDLQYVGRSDSSSTSTHYWRIPSKTQPCWASVQLTGEDYVIGMSTRPPPPELKVPAATGTH